MAIEILKAIRLTENEAEELRKQSIVEGRKIVSEANDNAGKFVEQTVKEAEAEAKKIVMQAEKEAEIQKDTLLKQVYEECSQLKANSRKNMDKAVDIIVGRIVKAHGYS